MAFIPPPPHISLGIGAEIIYSFVIIVCSLMIYFGTKKIYDLSSYKGIKYFRQAFLLFAIAYFFRFLIEFTVAYLNINEIFNLYPLVLGYIAIFIFMYLSSISIFYLIYSVSWKKWKAKSTLYIFHAIAVIVALASIIFMDEIFYIGLNIILLIYAAFAIYFSRKNQKSKKNNFYIVYILLLIFWILNALTIFIPAFFDSLKLSVYLASSCIFLIILYKVLKKSGD